MTLRQFEVFLAVARAGGFRRAADAMHLTQPALSQHVRELERELGARLFDRTGRAVALTEAGRVLQEHAHRLFATLQAARDAIADLEGLQRGSLLLGASTTPGLYVLPKVIAAFRARYPGVEVTMRIANSRTVEERIRANELDLGVVGGDAPHPQHECLAACVADELVLVVGPKHPWVKRRQIAPQELIESPLLLREEGSATRQVTERALQQAGVGFDPGIELDHTEAIKRAVIAGLGVAFVSRVAVADEVEAGRLHALRLRGVRIERRFHVIHHVARPLNRTAQAFVGAIEAAATPRARPRKA